MFRERAEREAAERVSALALDVTEFLSGSAMRRRGERRA